MQKGSETSNHLFCFCTTTKARWIKIVKALGSWVQCGPAKALVFQMFYGLHFNLEKKILWLNACTAFQWIVWLERSSREFKEEKQCLIIYEIKILSCPFGLLSQRKFVVLFSFHTYNRMKILLVTSQFSLLESF